MYDINLKDCFREMVLTGGFTWQRNNTIAATDTTPAHTTTTMSKRNARPNNNQLLTYYLRVRYLLRIQQYPLNTTYNKKFLP